MPQFVSSKNGTYLVGLLWEKELTFGGCLKQWLVIDHCKNRSIHMIIDDSYGNDCGLGLSSGQISGGTSLCLSPFTQNLGDFCGWGSVSSRRYRGRAQEDWKRQIIHSDKRLYHMLAEARPGRAGLGFILDSLRGRLVVIHSYRPDLLSWKPWSFRVAVQSPSSRWCDRLAAVVPSQWYLRITRDPN